MAMERWKPEGEYTRRERTLLKLTKGTRKLFTFLREHRLRIFDDAFQTELEEMYRQTGAGREAVPPALLAMAVILQGYLGLSDADAVAATAVDLRWQMVLGTLGREKRAFSQGALFDFRERLIRTDMDRRLLERTIEVAKQTKAFDWKKLKKLRVAVDSSPLQGAGRVEDTINLLGHAAGKIVSCAAGILGWSEERVCKAAGIPVLAESSVKKGLDVDWTSSEGKAKALEGLVTQLDNLEGWIRSRFREQVFEPPLKTHLDTLEQIRGQDLEPDPSGGGKLRVLQGVAPDRRVSIEDEQMRHGRKTKSKRFNGYKRHLATDLDTKLVVACAVTPANRPEGEALPDLQQDIESCERVIGELHVDRGYIASEFVDEVLSSGGDVLCKPWVPRNGDLFTKAAFKMNMRDLTITCPVGEIEQIQQGKVVEFDPEACDSCTLRTQCTTTRKGSGRTVSIAGDERLQQRLRKRVATRAGRERLRERVAIEHSLAHISQRQGNRARYRGVRKNTFDLRRASAIQNLQTTQRCLEEAKAS